MPTLTLNSEIDAPVAVVWKLLTEVGRLPDISPSTVSVHGPSELDGVGDLFEQTVKLGGRRFTSRWQVTRFDANRSLTVEGSVLPGTHYAMTEEVARTDGDRTRFDLTIDYSLPFGPIGRLAAKLGAERRALSEARGVVAGIARLAERDARDSRRP